MTGLDKIIKEIQDEAAGEAAAAIAKAKQEAAEILDKAQAENEEKAAHIAADAARTVTEIERARESAIALQRRQQILQNKQSLLNETLTKAQTSLHELPESEYFALLVLLAAASAQPGEGELLLNEKDKARMPATFAANVSSGLKNGAKLAVSANTRPIDGGFVLKYGDVEENCSFKAIFDARKEEFTDAIRTILFV